MNNQRLARYIKLSLARRKFEEKVKDLSLQEKALEAQLLEDFQRAGVQSLKSGGSTVYLQRQLWASAKDGNFERACLALRDAGLGDLVQERFNTSQVSAYVRERDREGEALPAPIADALNVSEVFSLRVRAS